jgi:hypothetical protein
MSFIKRIILFSIFYFLFIQLSFSVVFEDIKNAYEKREYAVVVSLFEKIDKKSPIYLDKEKEILIMTSRSFAEVGNTKSELNLINSQIEDLFEKLLYLDHNFSKSELPYPGKNPTLYLEAFDKIYNSIYGQLNIKVNKPDIEVKINDKSVFYSSDRNKEIVIPVWVGKESSKEFIVDTIFNYSFYEKKQPYIVNISSGKTETLNINIKPIFLSRKENFISLLLEQSFSQLTEKFLSHKENLVQPWNDITGFELGIGFKNRYFVGGKYDKNFNIINPKDKWKVKPIKDFMDYDSSNMELKFEISMVKTQYFSKPVGIRLGYRKLNIDFITYKGLHLNSGYDLFFGGLFFSTRTEKRNDIFTRLNLDLLLGTSNIEYVKSINNIGSLSLSAMGIWFSGEIGYSYNSRFDFSLGASYESIGSRLKNNSSFYYNGGYISYNENSTKVDTINLLKFFMHLLIRI